MTLKTQKFRKKNLTFFAEKFWKNILTHFQKFPAKMFRFWSKKWLILQDFGKKNNLPQRKIWVCRARKRSFFFFFFFFVAYDRDRVSVRVKVRFPDRGRGRVGVGVGIG